LLHTQKFAYEPATATVAAAAAAAAAVAAVVANAARKSWPANGGLLGSLAAQPFARRLMNVVMWCSVAVC